MKVNPMWGRLREVVPLSELKGKSPGVGETWVNFSADMQGVLDFVFTEVTPSQYGVWVKRDEHAGVLRYGLDLGFIFRKGTDDLDE